MNTRVEYAFSHILSSLWKRTAGGNKVANKDETKDQSLLLSR